MNSPRRNVRQPQESGRAAAASDCWEEMQALSTAGNMDSWATLASQRPATELRLSQLVGALEQDIIPRLVRAHAANINDSPTAAVPSADEVAAFSRGILAHDDPLVDTLLAQMRGRGVAVNALCTDLLAPVARHLGELWEDDRCHFTDVTIGVGRLQQIMRSLSSAFGTEVDAPAGGRRALLMPAPGEQHTFGLSMVAEFFARGGWEVAGVLDPLASGFQDRVAKEWFDLVGISAGSSAKLDGVQACIEAVRQYSHNRATVIMVGGPLFNLNPELADQVRADAVVTDGLSAPRLAEQLLSRRAQLR